MQERKTINIEKHWLEKLILKKVKKQHWLKKKIRNLILKK